MTPPSTPITECSKALTAAERKALAEGAPPYDGVRTWGDLLVVRESMREEEHRGGATRENPR